MARTTPALVRGLTESDESLNVTPFIAVAHSLTNKVAGADSASLLDSTDLELIERNLAAHCYAFRDQMLTSKSEGRASGSFQGQTAMLFDYSPYGQMAKLLDVTGFLAKLQKEVEEGGKRKVGVIWLGTPAEDIPLS